MVICQAINSFNMFETSNNAFVKFVQIKIDRKEEIKILLHPKMLMRRTNVLIFQCNESY